MGEQKKGSDFRIDKPQRGLEPVDALYLMRSEGQCHGSADGKNDERSEAFEDLGFDSEEDLIEKLDLTVGFEPLMIQR